MELRPYQQEAVDAVWNHLRTRKDNPCVVLPTGCHAKGHPILMYDGTVKKVEDIQVGDLIMGNDSTPRRVLQLARGREPMAKIIPISGEPFIVNMHHILSLISTNEGKGKYPCYQRGGEITNITVQDYISKSKNWKHLRKLYCVPIEFNNNENLEIPPYQLGLLIGDGCIIHGVGLTTADPELAEEFIQYAESQGCKITVVHNGSKAYTYNASVKKGHANPIMEKLRIIKLFGCDSFTKFIPHKYLCSSKNNRYELLAGLLDTDGYQTTGCFEYITASKQLANDICFLARSLGYHASMTTKFCKCQTGAGNWYFRLHISGDLSQIPFRRFKHCPSIRLQKKDVLRTGFDVELLPEDDFYGFALDGNHLYVDGNFVVHHNTGKSIVIGQIVSDTVGRWHGRVLVLAHVKELLEQNTDKIRKLCPNLKIGIYSAGLKSRNTKEDVIVAGIQSVYKRACELGAFDLVIIDEAHLIPPDGDGMYRTFLNDMKIINPNVRLIGFTATPYRLKGGLICKPENLLNHICYEAGLKEMINQGYLSPIIPKAGTGSTTLDFDSLHVKAGEFVSDEIEVLMNNEALVKSACHEIVELTKDRNATLIFGVSIDHCKRIKKHIEEFSGEECALVTGDTPANERALIIDRIKGKQIQADLFGNMMPKLRYLVNCAVLTTGFDAPNIDCVAILRPTASPGLLVQMVGRGLRLSPETSKREALILDYGGNIMRHGPLDAIRVEEHKGGKRDGVAPAKKCPNCNALIETARTVCQYCGYVFPPRELKHDATASADGLLTGQVAERECEVESVSYQKWVKKDADPSRPPTLRIEYKIGFNDYFSEWLCPEHTGYARQKFEKWWEEHKCFPFDPTPDTVDDAVHLATHGTLKYPVKIKIRHVAGEKFDRISHYEFGTPPATEEYAQADLDTILGDAQTPAETPVYVPPVPDDGLPF